MKQESQERAETVRALVGEILEKMTLPADIVIEEPTFSLQGEFVCQIRIAEGSNLLIGQRGLNLEALQTIARASIRRKLDGWTDFSVDVNSYWKEKAEALFSEATAAETKVAAEKTAISFRPMTPFERKCIHMALAESTTVTTESSGTGEHRKVVVKPKSDL
jgi:spoIIIJ-associated protein